MSSFDDESQSLGVLFLESIGDRLPANMVLEESVDDEVLRIASSVESDFGALVVLEAVDELTIVLDSAHTHVSLMDYMCSTMDVASKRRQVAKDAADLVLDIINGVVVFFRDVENSNVDGIAARIDLEDDVLAGKLRLTDWTARLSE